MHTKKPKVAPAEKLKSHSPRLISAVLLVGLTAFGFYRYATDCETTMAQFWLYVSFAGASYAALVWLWSGHGWYITLVRAVLLAVPYIVLAFIAFTIGFDRCFTF